MAALQERADLLLERWKQELQRLPLPAHVQVTGGEAGERMEKLAVSLVAVVDDEDFTRQFEPGGESYVIAEELGRQRRQQGYSIEELVQEHVIMRNEFWNLFREQVDLKYVVDFQLEKRVNSCFDLLLQAAASAYHYEHSREIMENPLRDRDTGIYNKNYFHGRMIEELRRSVRYAHDITLVLFEIGNYASVLEAEGSERTRELLRSVASALVRMTRDCDVVARLGEGSFAVLLPETGWRGGKVMSERLCRYFQSELRESAAGMPLEFFWGLASFPEEVRFPEKLYACAVEAMRQARDLPAGEIAVYRGTESSGGS
ncbi:MAG: diguanylate cyclase [Actinobacteria bacterium]|nr:diguanylate cyclase [Actinomycetota bacterium]MDI6830002.1 GGDEF domain-containing protein [Actinomycetota bacterium]